MTHRNVCILRPTRTRPRISRRFLITSLILLLSLPAAHLVWLLHAQHRLDTTLRAIRDAGEPIDPDDFRTAVPPPGQNAVDDLLAAGDGLNLFDNSAREFDRLWLNTPLTEKEAAVLKTYTDRRRDQLRLAESAATKPAIHWPLDPAIGHTSGLAEARYLANLLRADTLLAHHQRDDARALTRIDQALAVARIIDHQPADSTCYAIAAGITAMTAQMIEDIAPGLRLDGASGVARSRVRSVIARLLDDRSANDALRLALRADRRNRRLNALYMVRAAPPGYRSIFTQASPWPAYFAKPLLLLDADASTRLFTSVLRSFDRSPNWPSFRDSTNLAAEFPELAASSPWYPLASSSLESPTRPVRLHFRILTDLHLAATALAIRCYTLDHAGQLPPALDALVPTYLSAVPTDPMSRNNAPLRYSPNPADPIVYSVGLDTTDDGGSEYPSDDYLRREVECSGGVARFSPPAFDDNGEPWDQFLPGPDAPLDRWNCLDAVLHLGRQPRYQPEGQREWQLKPLRD